MQILLPPPVPATHPTDQNIKSIFQQWFKAPGINYAPSPPPWVHAAFHRTSPGVSRTSWGWGTVPVSQPSAAPSVPTSRVFPSVALPLHPSFLHPPAGTGCKWEQAPRFADRSLQTPNGPTAFSYYCGPTKWPL